MARPQRASAGYSSGSCQLSNVDAGGSTTGRHMYKYDLLCPTNYNTADNAGWLYISVHVSALYEVGTNAATEDLNTTAVGQIPDTVLDSFLGIGATHLQWICGADPWTAFPPGSCRAVPTGSTWGDQPHSVLGSLNDEGLSIIATALVVELQKHPMADLTVASIKVSDKTGVSGCGSGDGNTVSVVVHNSGNAAPQPADLLLQYYGGERTLAGAVTAGPGRDQQLVFPNVPMQPGSSSLGVVVNPGLVNGTGGVAESDKTNNYLAVSVTCVTQPATLSFALLQILDTSGAEIKDSGGKPSCLAGPNNTIRAKVSNSGDTDPGVVDLQLLVDNKPAGTASMGGIGAHSDKLSSLGTVSLTLGSHTLQVVIDPKGKAIKSDLLAVTCTAPPQ